MSVIYFEIHCKKKMNGLKARVVKKMNRYVKRQV